jgi:hypothetical protein
VKAKRKFCESQSLRDWSLHADRVKISAAEFHILKASYRQTQSVIAMAQMDSQAKFAATMLVRGWSRRSS